MFNKDHSAHIEFNTIFAVNKTRMVDAVVDGKKTRVEELYVAKEIVVKRTFHRESITAWEQCITKTNTVSKTSALIFDKYSNNHYKVAHSYESVSKKLTTPPKNKIGY